MDNVIRDSDHYKKYLITRTSSCTEIQDIVQYIEGL